MKSNSNDLKKRGLVHEADINAINTLSLEELLDLLNSKAAVERTAAAIVLRTKCCINDTEYIKTLLKRLSEEKALYTKIELCNTLESGNELTAILMCDYLGKIGENQHKVVPNNVSKKKSYPLPKDIIARSLSKMDPSIMNVLMEQLRLENRNQLSELIDAIGFMTFYNQELATSTNFNNILNTYEHFINDQLMVWKIALCCSAFHLVESEKLLQRINKTSKNHTIILETERSLKMIKNFIVGI